MKRFFAALLILILTASDGLAAWAQGTSHNCVGDKTANQASKTVGILNANVPAGDVVFVFYALDNNQTTDGDESAVSSITDTQSNTYQKVIEFTNGQGTAQTGAVAGLWRSTIATALVASTDTITVNFTNSASRDATGVGYYNFTKGAGNTVTVEGSTSLATDALDPGSISLSGLASNEHLYLAVLAGEGPGTDGYTDATNYTGIETCGTTGGGAATNMHVYFAFRIVTNTGDTYDITSTTADRDYAQVYAAFKEAAAGGGGALRTLTLMGVGR